MTQAYDFYPTAINNFAAFDEDLLNRAVNNLPLTGPLPKPIDPPDTTTTVTAARVEETVEEEYQSLDEIMAELAAFEPSVPASATIPVEPILATANEEDWDSVAAEALGIAEEPQELNEDDHERLQNLSQEVIAFVLDYPDMVPPEFWKVTSGKTFEGDDDGRIFGIIHRLHELYGVVPTRAIVREEFGRTFLFDAHDEVAHRNQIDTYKRIIALLERKSNPRETLYIAAELMRIIEPWLERRKRFRLAAKLADMNRAVENVDDPTYTVTLSTMASDLQIMAAGDGDEQDEFTWGELVEKYPEREPPIIDGLVREAQIANLVSSSKEGKSWMTYGLAFSVITGKPWLGTFPTVQGKVLIVDNELSREELSHRTRKVAMAMGVSVGTAKELLVIKSLKHKPQSLSALANYFNKIKPGSYKLIILDAMYKFMEDKTDENSNADIGRFYAMLGEYAAKTKAAILLVHHSTKGNQSEKKITDVGSGAGAQSRAADCHIIFREHEEDGAMVLDAKVRSFAPVEPVVVRFQWPLWEPDRNLDPSQLATTTRRQQKERDEQGINSLRAELEKLPEDVWASASELEKRTSMGYRRIEKLLYQMPEVEQKATREDGKGIRYRLGAVVRRRYCDGITTDDATATVVPVASPKRATTTTGTDDGGTGFDFGREE